MSSWRSASWRWGQKASGTPAPASGSPLVAVCAVLVTIAPSSWLVPTDPGYLIAGTTLLAVCVYGLLSGSVQLRLDAVFLVLFAGYWIGLCAQYWLHDPHSELLVVLLSTPVAVFATVWVLPQLVERGRHTFAAGLALSGAALSVIGVLVLLLAGAADPWVPDIVGKEVMGLYEIRTVSVFANPNPYGFFMMVGSLAALYAVLVRGGSLWLGAAGLCLLGLVMSEGDAALLGFGVGAVVLLSGRSRLLSVLGVGAGVVALLGLILTGHVPEVMRTTLLGRAERWVRSLELVAANPLWGIGFSDVGAELGAGPGFDHSALFPPLSADTGTSSGPHSAYVYPLLSTGLVTGGLYLAALCYALGQGIRRRWTPWRAYVVGTAAGIYAFMFFESHLLGGVGVSAAVFGLFVGLMLVPGGEQSSAREHAEASP